jgi:microcystin-dependent protein
MAEPFIGEIRLFAGNFAPNGWALCQGQLMAIVENEALFNLIGTTYGGDGQNTFALPDLSGRVPVHQGAGPGLSNRVIGQRGGSEQVSLTLAQMPAHTHTMVASSAPAQAAAGPSGNVLAATTVNVYGSDPPATPMAAGAISPAGGAQPHDNMAPFVAMSYIISLFGVFPSQA